MKRSTLISLALGAAAVFSAGHLFGQNKLTLPVQAAPAAQPAQTAQAKQQKLIKIATLPTAELNREFQNNVRVMQAQRQAAVELNNAYEAEKDAKKKAELKQKLDAAMTKLNEDNQRMVNAYGFSLNRAYTMEVVSSNIYMLVTDEEAAAFEKAQAADAAKAAKK